MYLTLYLRRIYIPLFFLFQKYTFVFFFNLQILEGVKETTIRNQKRE